MFEDTVKREKSVTWCLCAPHLHETRTPTHPLRGLEAQQGFLMCIQNTFLKPVGIRKVFVYLKRDNV